MQWLARCASLVALAAVVSSPSLAAAAGVQALFDLGLDSVRGAPFPSDRFTVADESHNTGVRVNLPKTDCAVHVSDCDDVVVLNELDGFNIQPRLSIPFSGPIDVETVTPDTVFLVSLGSALPGSAPDGRIVGINDQIVWDVATNTLHVETDELLDQHSRYALIVTRGVRDAAGQPIEASGTFQSFRHGLKVGHKDDPALAVYRSSLLDALARATEAGVRPSDIAVASVFTTQSVTAILERIRDQIKAATPAPATFLLGPAPNRTRTVFPLAEVTRITFTRDEGAQFVSAPLSLPLLKIVPDAVGQIAFGKYLSPDYVVHPGEFMPPVGTRTGTPVVQRQSEIYFNLVLPAPERKPADGWPVVILGHGGGQHKNNHLFFVAATMAQHGIATIEINADGRGFGARSTLTVNRTTGGPVTFPAGGRGIDQDKNGTIPAAEGGEAASPRALLEARDGERQTVVDLMQLVRAIEVGMDVDGDGFADLDASRIYYLGFSFGANYGLKFVAVDPSVRAAAFHSPGGPLVNNRRLGLNRFQVGDALAARTPSLINPPGIKVLDGVEIPGPYFDDNMPLRDGVLLTVGLEDGTGRPIQSPVLNTVPGAMAIQEVIEHTEWVSQAGSSVAYAPYLRKRPLAGVPAKPVLFLFGKGDQTNPNPTATAILRAGELGDRATFFRTDLAVAQDDRVPKNPHPFLNLIDGIVVIDGKPVHVDLVAEIAADAQRQVAVFFESRGREVIALDHPGPLFEVPIVLPLPEDLGFIAN